MPTYTSHATSPVFSRSAMTRALLQPDEDQPVADRDAFAVRQSRSRRVIAQPGVRRRRVGLMLPHRGAGLGVVGVDERAGGDEQQAVLHDRHRPPAPPSSNFADVQAPASRPTVCGVICVERRVARVAQVAADGGPFLDAAFGPPSCE